jgi:hypothetical protein
VLISVLRIGSAVVCAPANLTPGRAPVLDRSDRTDETCVRACVLLSRSCIRWTCLGSRVRN